MKTIIKALLVPGVLLCGCIAVPCMADLDFGEVNADAEQVKEIILLDKDSSPIPFGGSAEFEAVTFPEGLPVSWSIQPADNSGATVTAVENGSFITLTPKLESDEGYIEIEAWVHEGQKKSAKIYVGCQVCSTGDCSFAGSGYVTLGSINIRISLGKTGGGMSAGDLFIKADKPDADVFTPKGLELSSLSDEVITLYQDGVIRQIITPQSFVIVEPSTAAAYEILFYDTEDQGDLVDGFYTLKPYAEPLSAWRIENPDSANQTFENVHVTEFRLGSERTYQYSYEEDNNIWRLVSGNGLKEESRHTSINADGNRVERTLISGRDGSVVSAVEKIFHTFDWGEELVEQISDPEGDRLTTKYTYLEDGPGAGKLALRIEPDGSWTRYEYDNEGRIVRTVTPFLDAAPDAGDAAAKVVINSYEPLPGDAGDEADRRRPRIVTTLINNTVTVRSFHFYGYDGEKNRLEIVEQCTTQDCAFGDGTGLRTVTAYYPKSSGPESRKIRSQLTPDGRLTRYEYEAGNFTPSPDPEKGVFSAGDGRAIRVSKLFGTESFPDGITYQTKKETTITDGFGNEVLQETYIKTESGFDRLNWSYNSYNDQGRLIETLYSNNTRKQSRWNCCGKQSSTDIYGITTSYRYDEMKRMIASSNEATGLVTEFSHDAAGRLLKTIEKNGGLTRVRASRFDLSGRVVERVDPAGLKTTIDYDRLKTTIVYPGGAQKITEMYLDGRVKGVRGSGVIARFYSYGVNPDGSRWTKESITREDSPRFTITTRNMLGRIIRVERPGYEVPQITSYYYNRLGQLAKITNNDQPTTIIDYDDYGNKLRTGFDLDNNDVLDLASMDRIQQSRTVYRKSDAGWWKEESRLLYTEDNSSVPVVVSTKGTRLSGWTDGMISEQTWTDINGNETRAADFLDRYNRTLTRRIWYPDSETVAEQVYKNLQRVAAQGKTGHVSRFEYDGLGRQISVMDPRTGMTAVHYNEKHQVDYSTDAAGNHTEYVYDPINGRRTAVINPLGKKSLYRFNDRNQLTHSWGDVPYPVEYRYNEYNELITMATFRDEGDWNLEDWPENREGDVTSWIYQESTGLLLGKRDAAGNGSGYSYNRTNRLKTRTDARGIETTYRYTPMGELVTTDYSDETPDLLFDYDRTGRTRSISDAVGTRSFTYEQSFLPGLETIDGPVPAQIARKYDKFARPQEVAYNQSYHLFYRYGKTGRFSQLDWQVTGETGTTRYDYLEHADLPAGHHSDDISVNYRYEPNRNLKTRITNSSQGQQISRYEYQYDPLGRRTSEKQSGHAFTSPSFALFDYNERNEIKSSTTFTGDAFTDQTNPIVDQTRFYQYDTIGNQVQALKGTQRLSYTTNDLNQYLRIDNHTPVEMAYDRAGNMTQWKNGESDIIYSYNAENRLATAEPRYPKEDDTRITYTYDYTGRQVEKKTYRFNKGTWNPASHSYFVYDGWNLIAEIDLNSNNETNYIWGLDIGGSIHGEAGGVGGLLARIDSNQQVTKYTYDNRGNISQLLTQDGTILATYEYDPYGNLLSNPKPNQDPNPFRFSTKYHDKDLNLYNYGYRHYSPQIARWLTRDPLGEPGGKNLYTFAKNSINNIDSNGLYGYDIHYVAVFATLRAAGKSAQDAWEIAYYSSYPDMDKRYDAFLNAAGAVTGSENAIKYQGYLHSLNGKDIDEINILRKCASCLIKADEKSLNLSMTDHQVDGVLLHLLGDTYSHLEMIYVWENGERVDYLTRDEAYSKGYGHALDYKFPDRFPYRPELANKFLNSVYSTFGGNSLLEMSFINDMISTLEYPKYFFSESIYDTVSRILISDDDLEQLGTDQREFDPGDHNVHDIDSTKALGVETISPENMGELLDVLIRCSEGSI